MSTQYLRDYNLTITTPQNEEKVIKDLKIEFDIVRSELKYPNTAVITITNANDNTTAALSIKGTKLTLNAGYQGNLGLLFKGEISNVLQSATSNERMATVYAKDGLKAWDNSTFNRTFSKKVSPDEILDEVIKSFEDISLTIKDSLPKSKDNLRGFSLSGMSRDAMDVILKKYDFDWSMQNEGLIIRDKTKQVSGANAIKINSKTGMINSPTVTIEGANVTTLLNPNLLPYRAFTIESVGSDAVLGDLHFRTVPKTKAEGTYQIREVNFKGNSREGEWTSTVTGITLNV